MRTIVFKVLSEDNQIKIPKFIKMQSPTEWSFAFSSIQGDT